VDYLTEWLMQFPEHQRDEIRQSLEEDIRWHCRALRHSNAPQYVRLREVLRERNIEPEKSVLLEYYDDAVCYYGVLITPERRVLQLDVLCEFEPNWIHTGAPPEWKDQVSIRDITDPDTQSIPQVVACALRMLDQGSL
jgi:hypothetical protein